MAVSDAQFVALARRVQSLEGRPVYVPSGLPSGGGGGEGVSDHGALSGLADDDHAQYHNNVRGDARYYTEAEVDTGLALKAPLANPVFTGNPTAPTPATADNDTSVATTAFVKAQAYAPLASPVFTGNPTAPTPGTADNDTSLATTAMVQAAISAGGLGGSGIVHALVHFSTDITVSGSEASPTEVVTSGQITYDGTPILIEFYCAAMETGTTAGDAVLCNLFDVNTDLGRIAVAQTPAAAIMRATAFVQRTITPSAGDHTYRIRAWKSGTGNGILRAGVNNYVPGFIRITKV